MNRRQKIVLSVTGIFLVLLILIGLTYAYFLTRINGNPNDTSISVSTANLVLEYTDGNGVLEASNMITPGTDITFKDNSGNTYTSKTFSVKNNGNSEVDYAVILDNLSITYASDATLSDETTVTEGQSTYFEYPDDFKMTITCTSDKGSTCNGKTGSLPITNDTLLTNNIAVGETQEYVLTLRYEDSGIDQSADMNKTFSGLIDIMDPTSSAEIEGTVTNYSAGDYVQINSETKTSPIDKNGYYKLINIKPGNHTLSIRNKTGIADSTQSITIQKGTTPGISDSVITITNDKRIINIDIDKSSKNYTINSELKAGVKSLINGTLSMNYTNGNYVSLTTNSLLEDSEIKTNALSYKFSVSNIGDTHQNITIKLTDINIDDILKTADFRWGLYNADTGNGLSFGIFKYSENDGEELIYTDTIIDAGDSEPNNYILRIWLHNDGSDKDELDTTTQTDLLSKNFSANITVTGEAIEYTDESCFTFSDGTITGYDIDTCGSDLVIPRTIGGVTVTNIGGEFDLSRGFTSVIFPDTITVDLINMFAGNELTHVTIPEGVTAIGMYAFKNNQLTSVFIPDTVNDIQEGAFGDNKLTSAIIPKFISEYAEGPFTNTPIEDIVLMEGVTTVPLMAGYTNLTSIEIPSSVTTIPSGTFSGCTNLTEIVVRGKSSVNDFNNEIYGNGLTTAGGLPESVTITFRP